MLERDRGKQTWVSKEEREREIFGEKSETVSLQALHERDDRKNGRGIRSEGAIGYAYAEVLG